MTKVCVIQADNRPNLDYLLLTNKVNTSFTKEHGYDYLFIPILNNDIHISIKPLKKYISLMIFYKVQHMILLFS